MLLSKLKKVSLNLNGLKVFTIITRAFDRGVLHNLLERCGLRVKIIHMIKAIVSK